MQAAPQHLDTARYAYRWQYIGEALEPIVS